MYITKNDFITIELYQIPLSLRNWCEPNNFEIIYSQSMDLR